MHKRTRIHRLAAPVIHASLGANRRLDALVLLLHARGLRLKHIFCHPRAIGCMQRVRRCWITSTCRERYGEPYFSCHPRAIGIRAGGLRFLSYRKRSQFVHSWSDGERSCLPQQTVTRNSTSVGAMSLLCLGSRVRTHGQCANAMPREYGKP